MQCDN